MRNIKELFENVFFEIKRPFRFIYYDIIRFEIPNLIYNIKVWYYPDFKFWFNCKRRDLYFNMKKNLRNVNFYIYVFLKIWINVIILQVFYFQPRIIYFKMKAKFFKSKLVNKLYNKLKKL